MKPLQTLTRFITRQKKRTNISALLAILVSYELITQDTAASILNASQPLIELIESNPTPTGLIIVTALMAYAVYSGIKK